MINPEVIYLQHYSSVVFWKLIFLLSFLKNFAILGLLLSFFGTLAIILETISGKLNYIRPNIYRNVRKRVYETNLNSPPTKMKLNAGEIRILIWVSLICVGFLFQIIGYLK